MVTTAEIRAQQQAKNRQLFKDYNITPPTPTRKITTPLPTPVDQVERVTSAPSSGRTAPLPTDPSKIEKTPTTDFQQFGLPSDVFSTEDPRSVKLFKALPTYNPPSGGDRAEYDAGYYKQALEASLAQTERVAAGAGAAQEQNLGFREEDFAKKKADALRGRTAVNPEYTKLSPIQKQLNLQYKKQSKDFIPETVSAESGRQPLQKNMSTQQKKAQATFQQAQALMATGNQDDIAQAQKMLGTIQNSGVLQNYVDYQNQQKQLAEIEQSGEAIAREIKKQERNIRDSLGMSPTDELTFDEDGQPLINGKTESEVAQIRATERSNRARQSDLKKINKNHTNNMASIRSAYTIDGKLSKQGVRALANATRENNDSVAEVNTSYDENLGDYLRQEIARDAEVRLQNNKVESPQAVNARIIAQERADGAYAIQKEYQAKGIQKSFEASLNEYVARQKFDQSEPSYADQAQVVDSEAKSSNFDPQDMFSMATAQFDGNTASTERYMKSRGYLQEDINEQKARWQIANLGYTPEQVETEKKEKSLKTRMTMALNGELDEDELETLQQELAISPTKTAFQFNYALERPDEIIDPIEIEMAWRGATKAPKTAKQDTLSYQAQAFLEKYPNPSVLQLNALDTSYGLDKKDKELILKQEAERLAKTPEEKAMIAPIFEEAGIIAETLPEEDQGGFWSELVDKVSGFFRGNKKQYSMDELDNMTTAELEELANSLYNAK